MATDDEKQLAFTQLAQGKRHLLVKDYYEAVSSLASACEYFAKAYGDEADECGEVYFNYGKALLELARSENGVLGNAVEEEIQSDDDDDEEEPDSKDGDDEVKPDQNGSGDGPQKNVPETDQIENGVEDSTKPESNETDSKANEGIEASTNGTEDGEEDEEDVSNLHLAWEILELAKRIFKRQSEKNNSLELKLADVHLLLGEVGLESENFNQGIEDMMMCLELQKKNLPPDSRCIAESYYQIGMGQGMANNFDAAIEAYKNCSVVLEKRVETLKKMIADGTKPEGDDPFYSLEGEIKDLEQLFPEIKEKISDMQDFKNETRKALLSAVMKDGDSDPGAGSSKDASPSLATPAFEGSAGSSSSTEAKPVSNISHLVRKKPRVESEAESKGNDSKRVCTDENK